jgi:hypothetical protein
MGALGGGTAGGASAEVAAAGPATPAQFTLVGTVLSAEPLAWLAEPTLTGGGAMRLRVGDQIGAYRLVRVEADRVELDGPGGRLWVRLGGAAAEASPAPTPAAVAAPPGRGALPPGVVDLPLGDPRRRTGFGALFGDGGPRPQ